jgi:Flp pilus assembly protein CpaB
MNRRTLAILILVVGIIMLSIVGILFIVNQDSPQPAPPPAEVTDEENGEPVPVISDEALPDMVEVVVSLQTVPRGWQFTENELVLDMRVRGAVGPNVITNIEDAVGLYARTDIYQGATLTRDLLANDITQVGLEEFGPASLIPQGFLAYAVPMNRLSGVAYALSEGDYVDIMITFWFYQIDQEFQTYLQNSAVFFLEEVIQAVETEGEETAEEEQVMPDLIILDQFGRFERLPNGDIAHIGPSEPQRPIPVSMVLQNARVIQVGIYTPADVPQAPTPTLDPEEPTPEPDFEDIEFLPEAPDTLLVALSPQQQLLLKYAVESQARISFALRGANDSQLYAVENVDINYFLRRFGIEEPENYTFSVDNIIITVTPTDNGVTE